MRLLVIEKALPLPGVTPGSFDAALQEGFAWYRSQTRRQVDDPFGDRLPAAIG